MRVSVFLGNIQAFLEFVTFFRVYNMSTGAAKIGQPAPFFQAEALVDGKVKQVKLSDYKGLVSINLMYDSSLFC